MNLLLAERPWRPEFGAVLGGKGVVLNIFDNLIAQKRVPAMVVIQSANGGGDAQGHQRGKEYDTMSAVFADYIKAKGCDYQYFFCQNSGHSVNNAKAQFLPHAIEWVWHGYSAK